MDGENDQCARGYELPHLFCGYNRWGNKVFETTTLTHVDGNIKVLCFSGECLCD